MNTEQVLPNLLNLMKMHNLLKNVLSEHSAGCTFTLIPSACTNTLLMPQIAIKIKDRHSENYPPESQEIPASCTWNSIPGTFAITLSQPQMVIRFYEGQPRRTLSPSPSRSLSKHPAAWSFTLYHLQTTIREKRSYSNQIPILNSSWPSVNRQCNQNILPSPAPCDSLVFTLLHEQLSSSHMTSSDATQGVQIEFPEYNY